MKPFPLLSLLLVLATGCALERADQQSDDPEAFQADSKSSALAPAFVAGVNVHNWLKPYSYGYTAANGGDRMGAAMTTLGVRYVRGALIGDVAFLARLKSFGATHVILTLEAKNYGKPFDAQKLRDALALSLAEATRLGLVVVVEGLNEWDLFNSKTYNAGVIPAGTTVPGFVTLTQRALYEAAHPLGIPVLGPSCGHPYDQKALDFFPDVSAYVDIVNIHMYISKDPKVAMPIADYVQKHARWQGAGKRAWVTETGISSYAGVTWAQQAEAITRGFGQMKNSGLIDVAFNYELIEANKAGWVGFTYTWDSDQWHFGVFNYYGQAKTAAGALKAFISP